MAKKLMYIGSPGQYFDFEKRSGWQPNDVREVDEAEFNRLIGTGLFRIVEEMKPENKMETQKRTK